MAEQSDERDTKKKPYAKPDVSQVTLRPEEAILGSCKTGGTSGPGQAKCSVPSACSSLAS
jgi:hypothetical protein